MGDLHKTEQEEGQSDGECLHMETGVVNFSLKIIIAITLIALTSCSSVVDFAQKESSYSPTYAYVIRDNNKQADSCIDNANAYITTSVLLGSWLLDETIVYPSVLWDADEYSYSILIEIDGYIGQIMDFT